MGASPVCLAARSSHLRLVLNLSPRRVSLSPWAGLFFLKVCICKADLNFLILNRFSSTSLYFCQWQNTSSRLAGALLLLVCFQNISRTDPLSLSSLSLSRPGHRGRCFSLGESSRFGRLVSALCLHLSLPRSSSTNPSYFIFVNTCLFQASVRSCHSVVCNLHGLPSPNSQLAPSFCSSPLLS